MTGTASLAPGPAPADGGELVPPTLSKFLPVEGQSAGQLLHTFLRIQGHRAELYSTFHAGFKAFLSSREEARYNLLLQHLTALFGACSQRVLEVEGQLKVLGRTEYAALLRRVQEGERDKLQLTLSLQALKQAFAFKSFSWQQEGAEPGIGGGLHPVAPPATGGTGAGDPHGSSGANGHGHSHAHTHHRGGGCGCGHGKKDAPPEPTQYEYESAVQEALREVNSAIEKINEALEEVRYCLEEEGDEQ